MQKPITHSRVLSIGLDMTERKIKKRIYKMLRPLLKTPLSSGGNGIDEEAQIEQEYK